MTTIGRKGVINERDARIFTDLYLTSCLSTEQAARLHFSNDKGEPSPSAAERKLYRMLHREWVESHSVNTPQGNRWKVWTLTRDAWRREHRDLTRGPEREPDVLVPRPGHLEHYISTNDLYARAAPLLRHYLGEPDARDGEGWRWRNEYRCEHEVSLGSGERKIEPDAELALLGETLYLENQTHRSHASTERMTQKVEDYAVFFRHVLKDPENNQLLVLTGESAIVRAVEARGEELGILVTAGIAQKLAEHVEQTAMRLC